MEVILLLIMKKCMFSALFLELKLRLREEKMEQDPVAHVSGAEVKLITDADDAAIEIGDDFGFDGL